MLAPCRQQIPTKCGQSQPDRSPYNVPSCINCPHVGSENQHLTGKFVQIILRSLTLGGGVTGCIEGILRAEKFIEDASKITNSINVFLTLKKCN